MKRDLFRVLAAACALTAGLSACSTESKDAAPGGGSGPKVEKLSPGVTDNSIKIGVVYPDLASVKAFINLDQGDYPAMYKALIDKINADGGIAGRKLVPVLAKLDILSPVNYTATCVKLTEDEQVFAVIGTFGLPDQPLCYVSTHRTALIGGALSQGSFTKAKAPWFSYDMGGDEIVSSLKALNGQLTGRKVAVISTINDQAVMQNKVLPELKKLGITPVSTAVIDANTNDPTGAARKTGVALQKFQAAKADTVLNVAGVAALLPGVLERTPWRPKLLFTSLSLLSGGYLSDRKTKHDFSVLKGSYATSALTNWSDPGLGSCLSTIEAAVPATKGKLLDPLVVPAGDPVPGAGAAFACDNLALFKAVAAKAGKDLNYQSFQNAGFSLGTLHLPGYADDATYGRQSPAGDVPQKAYIYNLDKKRYEPAPSS